MRTTRTPNDAFRRPSHESLAAREVRHSVSAVLIGLTLYSPSPVGAAAMTPLRLVTLRTEYKENPLGIDARKPPRAGSSRPPGGASASRPTGSASGQTLADGNGITGHRQDGDASVIEVGSGQYRFAYPWGE